MERGKFSGFDHVDARVRDLAAARTLYDALMPALGLPTLREEGQVEYYHPPLVRECAAPVSAYTRIRSTSPIRHASRSPLDPGDVDRLAAIARSAGAADMEGPEIPYSSERYYAVFFRDPSGNRIEICYRRLHEDRSEALASGT